MPFPKTFHDILHPNICIHLHRFSHNTKETVAQAPFNPAKTVAKTSDFYTKVHQARQGYFYTANFVPLARAKASRSGLILQQGLQSMLGSSYCQRYLVDAGFDKVAQNLEAFRTAQEVLSNAALVMSMNMVQRPYGYPSRLYRLSAGLDAYLPDRPSEMEKYHLLGVTNYDADMFQRLSSKLLWSMGAPETSLNPQEQEAFLQMLIEVCRATLCQKL
jgi:hypothetical protein